MNTKPVSKQTLRKFKSSQRRCFIQKAVLNVFAIFTGKHLCWSLLSLKLKPWRPAVLLKKTPTEVFYCEYCEILRTPILKNSCKRLLLYILSLKLEKWEMENSSKRWPCLWNIQKQPFRGAQKDTNPKHFLKF